MVQTFEQLKQTLKNNSLLEFIIETQCELTSLKRDEFFKKIEDITDTMLSSVRSGLNCSDLSKSKLSGKNASILREAKTSPLISSFAKKAITYSFAVTEQNARMGKIAACPTAGSSGIVPSVLICCMEEFNKTKSDLINSLIIAGEIGRIISIKVPPAGAVAGCQAECGTACAMASGALCYMLGFDINTIFNACAISLKNTLGLTCDPVAGLVEVPCVKRNAVLTGVAINSAYLAMSGIKSEIPVDDVVDAMRETGILMSPKLKESSKAGLATTGAGIEINNSLYNLLSGRNF